MCTTQRRSSSVIVYLDGEALIAEDARGSAIATGRPGQDDAAIIQAAIDYQKPGGEVRLCRGQYSLTQTVVIANSVLLSGEGRGTVIAPPAGDYALKVTTTDATETYRPYQPGGRLFGVIVRDLAIDGTRNDGARRGKGIYLGGFWSSSFENLWIENTGTALHMHHMAESEMSNLWLIANGDPDAKEASVVMTGGNNNIHISGMHLIYPNYIGLEMFADAEGRAPRHVFITDSMFHGWLPGEKAESPIPGETRPCESAPYDLIVLRDIYNAGRRTGAIIANSRITVPAVDQASVRVINSPLTIRDCTLGSSQGKYTVQASDGACVSMLGNTLHGHPGIALRAEHAEVLFEHNVLESGMLVSLAPGFNSIIADNRFVAAGDKPCVWIGDDGETGSANVQVRGNVFPAGSEDRAVEVSRLCERGIDVHDNQQARK